MMMMGSNKRALFYFVPDGLLDSGAIEQVTVHTYSKANK